MLHGPHVLFNQNVPFSLKPIYLRSRSDFMSSNSVGLTLRLKHNTKNSIKNDKHSVTPMRGQNDHCTGRSSLFMPNRPETITTGNVKLLTAAIMRSNRDWCYNNNTINTAHSIARTFSLTYDQMCLFGQLAPIVFAVAMISFNISQLALFLQVVRFDQGHNFLNLFSQFTSLRFDGEDLVEHVRSGSQSLYKHDTYVTHRSEEFYVFGEPSAVIRRHLQRVARHERGQFNQLLAIARHFLQ